MEKWNERKLVVVVTEDFVVRCNIVCIICSVGRDSCPFDSSSNRCGYIGFEYCSVCGLIAVLTMKLVLCSCVVLCSVCLFVALRRCFQMLDVVCFPALSLVVLLHTQII